jgi:Zn-dependent protease with chaperone function
MRKYQEQREDARGLTTELCLLLAVAVVGTIVVSALAIAVVATVAPYEYMSNVTTMAMPPGYWQGIFWLRLVQSGVLTTLLVVGTAAYKTWQLSEGGGRAVATSMGGARLHPGVTDPSHVKVLNVVEELAIATSMRAPPVYVLENEPGINAFAAGFEGKDAVVGVTRGAIDKLKRHQLQGVIAHEFSHIANGDMRLNIRLLGILAGIQAITFVAQFLLRLGTPASDAKSSGKHPLGMILALIFGIVVWPIGQVGTAFAMLIHMAVNRQREFLADASAVQFTRDPHGICEALAILLEDEAGSRVQGPGAQLASHMFFASGGRAWARLLEAHPPVEERICRLDPNAATAAKHGIVEREYETTAG